MAGWVAGWVAGWLGGWVGGGCFLTIRLSQPSLAGVRAGAELGNNRKQDLVFVGVCATKRTPRRGLYIL